MSELDKACLKLAEKKASIEWEERTFSDKYKGDFKSRSGLSSKDFQERKSRGRYSWN